jgi:hypothetical protein
MTWRRLREQGMGEQEQRGLKIFLQYWGLIAVLAAFNIYNYVKNGHKLSLALSIVCGVAFVGWVFFYVFWVRPKK